MIKICGVRSVADARACADAGADLVGLNFVSGRRRAVDIDTATQIAKACAHLQRVGVFMDAELDAIRSVTSKVPLDWVQLHGDEPPAVCAALATDHKIIKAFGVTDAATFEDLAAYVPHVQAFLLDAPRPGSGQTFDWDLIARCPRDRPVFVAGGLNPDNVNDALVTARPDGVDTASGIEIDGAPDPGRIHAFCEAVRSHTP